MLNRQRSRVNIEIRVAIEGCSYRWNRLSRWVVDNLNLARCKLASEGDGKWFNYSRMRHCPASAFLIWLPFVDEALK